MNLANMRLGKRLALGFGILTAFTLGIAVMAWWGNRSVNLALDNALGEADKMRLAQEVSSLVDNINMNIWNIAGNKDQAKKQEYKAEIGKLRESYKKRMEELKAGVQTGTGKELLRKGRGCDRSGQGCEQPGNRSWFQGQGG